MQMKYPHKLVVEEIPVPAGYIRTMIESDMVSYKTTKEFYATPEEFLTFWQPLVEHYERVKNANSIQN
jgi:hypothetical protein